MSDGAHGAFGPLCLYLTEHMGQQQALAYPLQDPATGRASILSAWGDEARGDFSAYVAGHGPELHMASQAFLALLQLRWPVTGGPVLRPVSPRFRDLAPPDPPLSERERQVLGGLADGHGAQHIADALGLSDRSVREYIRRAQVKLAAPSRTAAVARATALGLI
ncbi:helix-turn-helix transcriptional regulator [Pseudoroseicyclus sp. H15]